MTRWRLATMYEVHIFLASAKAAASNERSFQPGTRHALLIMSRQPRGSDHNYVVAEQGAANAGWESFKFERAGTLIAENLNGKDRDFIEAFEHALLEGCSVIAYRGAVAEGEA